MNRQDIIHKKIIEDAMSDHREQKTMHPAVKVMLGLLFSLLIIMIVIPYYSIKTDPSPKNIPSLSDLSVPVPSSEKRAVTGKEDYLYLVYTDPDVKRISDTVASKSCLFGQVCHAKAMYYFVRNEIQYISDPPDEYVESALEVLSSGGADCDGMAVLLANMLESVGVHTRLVFIPGHVYVQAKLPGALSKYKDSDDWVSLDATCKNCDFGTIPSQDTMAKKEIVEKW